MTTVAPRLLVHVRFLVSYSSSAGGARPGVPVSPVPPLCSSTAAALVMSPTSAPAPPVLPADGTVAPTARALALLVPAAASATPGAKETPKGVARLLLSEESLLLLVLESAPWRR